MKSGTRLGPYEMAEQLGAGGMGEVYLAQDTRLGRKVAVKVLPEQFAADPERLARFEQEARAAAALNHPAIASVHDVGEADGTHYIVQEYLEGHSLGSLLRDNPPKLERALEIGTAVAEALAAAHAAGIVHRDIKPDNIFITKAGHAKVLDFGLAKLVEATAVPGGSDPAASPTAVGTMAGVVMGTVGYMAPEQIEAGEIDGRTDVFSVGCVLYEMVSGVQPFVGKSVPDSLSAVLHREPEPLSATRMAAPPELQRIVSKCVQKQPARRYQGAADLAVDLRALAAGQGATDMGSAAAEPPTSQARRGVPSALAAAGAVLLAAVAALATYGWMRSTDPASSVSRFELVHPGGFDRSSADAGVLSISPDASRVAYVLRGGPSPGLWMRDLNSTSPTRVVPGEGFPGYPVFSPDGQRIAFADISGFMALPAVGGALSELIPAQEIGTIAGICGVDWTDTGALYVARCANGIVARGADDAELVTAVEIEAGEVVSSPQLLPGGDWLLFGLRRFGQTWSEAAIVVQHLDSGERRTLLSGGTAARYIASGHLLYVHDYSLFAAPFDLQSLAIGDAVRVIDSVAMVSKADSGVAHYDVADDGTLVYLEREPPLLFQPRWVERRGAIGEAVGDPLDQATSISLSPDGTRYLATAATQLVVERLGTGVRQVLPTGEARSSDTPAVWTPDGSEIIYEARDGHLYRIASDGSGRPRPLGAPAGHRHPMGWTAAGNLVFTEIDEQNIYSIGLDAEEPEPLLVRDFDDGLLGVATSPDGRWMAFTSAGEIWIQRLPDGRPVQVSSAGGTVPVWARDGLELYFAAEIDGVQTVMGVAFTGDDPSRPKPQTGLFAAPDLLVGGVYGVFDVAADGRFLVMGSARQLPPERHLHVVLNWFEELARQVPSPRG